jgi:uncharacterized Zn finger protein (UPF0148 family)
VEKMAKDNCQICGEPINRKNWPTAIYCLACMMKPKQVQDPHLTPQALYRDAMRYRKLMLHIDGECPCFKRK